MSQVITVVKEYNKYLLSKGRRPLKFSRPETEKKAKKLIAWCDKKGIDPVDYMTVAIPFSEKIIPLSRLGNKLGFAHYTSRRGDILLHKKIVTKSEVKLRPAQEKFKAHYAVIGEGSALCFAQREYAGGFNPKSDWCNACPYQKQCEDA
jgi:hypothetical protein